MERDVGHEQLYTSSLVGSLDVVFCTGPGPSELIYLDIKLCTVYHRQRHQLGMKTVCMSLCMRARRSVCLSGTLEALWRPLRPVSVLPENLSLLEFLSSTSPGRRHTRRGGNGRSPLVQPGERETTDV